VLFGLFAPGSAGVVAAFIMAELAGVDAQRGRGPARRSGGSRFASSSLTTSRVPRLSRTRSYPSTGAPPVHLPLRRAEAILSRVRSEMISRSNWAKDRSTLSMSRPIDVLVLNCWVTETNDTLCRSSTSMIFEKSIRLRLSRSTL
jgi:hypothetical protein